MVRSKWEKRENVVLILYLTIQVSTVQLQQDTRQVRNISQMVRILTNMMFSWSVEEYLRRKEYSPLLQALG